MDDDIHSVEINISIPRVCAKHSNFLVTQPQLKKTVNRAMESKIRKPSEISLEKYSLPSEKPLRVNDIQREEVLLPYKLYAKKQDCEKHIQKLGINIRDKYKIISTDMKKRLYVKVPCDDVKAITDIDRGFFNYVSGRAVSDHVPLYKSLKSLLNDQLRLRQEVGYRNDGILNIEVNHRKELEKYELSFQRYIEQIKYFDGFISEDYHKSMALLQQWDELKVKVNIKISELQTCAVEQFTIISRLIGFDYMYTLQQKYGRFLYYLSPPIWRIKNREFAHSVEIEAKGFDLGSSEEETFNVVFEKMQRECFDTLIKPALYFKYPHELLDIFDSIEKQQLHHFTYVTHLAPLKKILKEEIKTLKEFIAQDSSLVANTIRAFEIRLKFNDERCAQLENRFYAVLYGLFYDSVGAPDVLKFFLHLEFTYEKVLFDKAINLDIVTIAKSLENMYMDYSKRIDDIHSDTVQRAVQRHVDVERKKTRRAKAAYRELRVYNRLERDLLRAHAPSVKAIPNNKALNVSVSTKKTFISKKIKHQCSKIDLEKNTCRPLTESELEYLTLFTEWTQSEDPANYLHFDENRTSK
ncbi:uncharacterized protein ACR2FA_012606 [Aphomia sociella]